MMRLPHAACFPDPDVLAGLFATGQVGQYLHDALYASPGWNAGLSHQVVALPDVR